MMLGSGCFAKNHQYLVFRIGDFLRFSNRGLFRNVSGKVKSVVGSLHQFPFDRDFVELHNHSYRTPRLVDIDGIAVIIPLALIQRVTSVVPTCAAPFV